MESRIKKQLVRNFIILVNEANLTWAYKRAHSSIYKPQRTCSSSSLQAYSRITYEFSNQTTRVCVCEQTHEHVYKHTRKQYFRFCFIELELKLELYTVEFFTGMTQVRSRIASYRILHEGGSSMMNLNFLFEPSSSS